MHEEITNLEENEWPYDWEIVLQQQLDCLQIHMMA